MMKQIVAVVLAALMLGVSSVPQTQVVTAQILDYEKGYLFFTTGDGFHVSPSAVVVNGPPATRDYARVTFDATGTITRIEVSKTKLPPEGDLDAIHHFAVALSPAQPNPDLGQPPNGNICSKTIGGRIALVSVRVQVPASTPLSDTVYMTTDQSGWNPQAYRLDRLDALHYGALFRFPSGTVLHVLFDRGSTQTMQVQENGIEQQPYLLCVANEDEQVFPRIVYRWADQQLTGLPAIPQSMPTPYNPAPFPNLPSPPPGPARTPLPH